jgi:hypothetical protein
MTHFERTFPEHFKMAEIKTSPGMSGHVLDQIKVPDFKTFVGARLKGNVRLLE